MPVSHRALPRALKLTYDEYVALPLDDGRRHEILDGELCVTPLPLIRHQAVSRNLQRILDHHVLENKLGELFDAPVDLILARTTITVPDLVFVRGNRKSIITEKAIEGPRTSWSRSFHRHSASRTASLKRGCTLDTGFVSTGSWIRTPGRWTSSSSAGARTTARHGSPAR